MMKVSPNLQFFFDVFPKAFKHSLFWYDEMVWKVNVNNIEQVSTFTGKIIVLAWSHENDKSYKIISTLVMIKGVP